MENLTVVIILSVGVLMILSALTELVSKYTRLPFSIMLVVTGFLVSHLALVGPEFMRPLANFKIQPDIILYACLPTLIFESAFAMDARLFRHNLIPILTLAIPGLFLSTTIIGGIVYFLTPLDFMISLLLGAILSATDPVAVISLFKQLGVPKRLMVLVEGESLLNDSTAIVTAKTILFVMLAGTISSHTLGHSALEFCKEFFGGIIVGGVMTLITGYFLRLFEDEAITQLSLTVILAYLSFVVADDVFHVSGVMATITAGLMLAGWGRTKMSGEAASYLHNLLGLLAYIANALIFLLVGFSVEYSGLQSSMYILGMVIIAMLVSRAVVIYGLIPLIGRLPNAEPISYRYQTIMWWGGLRGAIALAIVLGLSELPEQQMLISVVMGAVLFTILVQGLSINKVIALLKMDKPPLSDRVAKLEAELSAEKITLDRLPELQEGGLFSLKIAEEIRERCEEALLESRKKLKNLREEELNITEEKRLLFLSCFAAEKHLYYQMFIKGHLSEKAFRVLNHDMDLEIDLMRYRSQPVKSLTANRIKAVLTRYISALDIIYFLRPLINQLKIRQTIAVYEEKWGLHQGSLAILNHLDEIASMESIEPSVVQEVRHQFQEWMQLTKTYLDNIAEQFPEFVRDIQKKLAERVLLHSKFETIEKQANDGLLPEGVADEILHQYVQEIRALKKISPSQLKLDPHELLRKIPFLSHIPSEEVEDIIHLLKERRFSPREIIIQEGAVEDDLYLILRGVVRVSKEISGKDIELATLMAGDFFGEIALLFGVKRTASCKAVTPCILYSLNRHDFDKVREKFPQIDRALRQEAEKRRNQQ